LSKKPIELDCSIGFSDENTEGYGFYIFRKTLRGFKPCPLPTSFLGAKNGAEHLLNPIKKTWVMDRLYGFEQINLIAKFYEKNRRQNLFFFGYSHLKIFHHILSLAPHEKTNNTEGGNFTAFSVQY
jgi:hypothetical protein